MKALYLCLELNSHPSAPALPSLYLCCVCPPLFISPLPFSLLHISCPPHFLLFLPPIEPSAALRPAPPLWIVGLQSQTQAMNQAAIRLTKPAPPMRSAFLLLTMGTYAVALSLRSFRLMRRGRQEITSGEPELRLEYQMREPGLSEARRLKDGVCSQAGNHLFAVFLSARLRINTLRPARTRVQHSCGSAPVKTLNLV